MVVQKPFNIGGLYSAESTYGTGVTPSTAIGRVQNINIEVNNNPIKIRGAGSGRNVLESLYGNLDVTFNWEQELHDGAIFSLIVGPRTGSGTAGSKYVFTEAVAVATTDLPFFTLEKSGNDTTDDGLQAIGSVVDSATLSFSLGATAKLSVSGVAQTVADVTAAQTYTEVSTLPWTFYQLTVKWGSSPTTIARILSGNVTINNNLVKYRQTGSRFIQQPECGLKDYTWTITCYMSETSYRTLKTSAYGSSTPSTGVASSAFAKTDNLYFLFSEGSSTGNRNLQFQFAEAIIDRFSEPIQVGNGLVQVTFSGHAHKGTSNQPVTYWTA